MSGFDRVTKENVFKVCDQPHPDLMNSVVDCCLTGEFEQAAEKISEIVKEGYNMMDICGTLTKICQVKEMDETRRLNYLKTLTEFKMKILEGLDSHLQLDGALAKLCIS